MKDKYTVMVEVRMRVHGFDAEDAAMTAGQMVQDGGYPVIAATTSGTRFGFELMPATDWVETEATRNEALENAPR